MILRSARQLRPLRSLAADLGAGPSARAPAPAPLRARAFRPAPASSARKPAALPLDPPPTDAPGPTEPGPAPSAAPVAHEPFDRGLPYRRGLLLFTVPVPPAQWPSHVELMSPLLSDAAFALKSAKLALNVVYDGEGSAASLDGLAALPASLIFPDGRTHDWDEFTRDTLDSPEFRHAAAYVPAPPFVGLARPRTVLVCTHGSRDCRCAERGVPLVQALREEGLDVREVAHVGGHRWAANALLLPSLDMFSNLDAGGARAFARFVSSAGAENVREWEHWRGRMGYDDLTQARLALGVDRLLAPNAAPLPPSSARALEPQTLREKYKHTPTVALRFTEHDGREISTDAPLGASLLEVSRLADLGLEGACGGNCECATCHVYVGVDPKGRRAPLNEPGEDEEDMLYTALGFRDGESRLGCQVRVSEELAEWNRQGGAITLPEF